MKILGLEIKREKRTEKSLPFIGNMECLSHPYGRFNPCAERNYLTLYKTMAEVQFPVRYITDRAVKCELLVKKLKDDSVVWDNQYINRLLMKPNLYYSFKDLMRDFIMQKLVCGNSYVLANTDPSMSRALYKYCENFIVLPAPDTDIKCAGDFFSEEYVKSYTCSLFGKCYTFDKELIFHERDGWDYKDNDLKGFSRLESVRYPLANLIAVYEARNVIYTKRGALGAIVSVKNDADGTSLLSPKEKEEVQADFQNRYGLSAEKSQFIISRYPLNFVRFGNTISELEPFEETLQDAIQIAGVFGLNKELVPRKDNSTFDNLHSAEVDCYTNVVIPMVKEFLSNFGKWVGIETDGYYLDADFSHVEVLSEHAKDLVDEKRAITDKCKVEFQMGIITLNDWRTQIGMEMLKDAVYNKTIFQMNEKELNYIQNIIK